MQSRIFGGLFLVAILFSTIAGCSPRPIASPIQESISIRTSDTFLHADIRGKNRNSPILLYLHGGPGNPFGILTFLAYSGSKLEENYVVVYLQQRGIMRSDDVPHDAHRIENYISDVDYVVRFLKNIFPDQDVNIFGHSWGGTLAYLYLLEHEGDIDRVVTACAPLNVKQSMRARYEETLRWAEEMNNEEAIRDLSSLSASDITEQTEDFFSLSKWTSVARGGMMRNVSPKRINKATEDEHLIGEWLEESRIIGDFMFDEIMAVDISEEVRYLETPLLVIAGEDDIDAPWEELKKSSEKYGGDVTFLLLKDSHHLVFVDQEEAFVDAVVSFLTGDRPEQPE